MVLPAKYDRFLQDIYKIDSLYSYKERVLLGLQDLLPFESGAFFLVKVQTKEFLDPVHYNIDLNCFQTYSKHYHKYDIYKETIFTANPVPIIDRASDYLDYREWEKNEHRADFLLKMGFYHLAGMQFFDEGKPVAELTFHRCKNQPDFNNNEMRILGWAYTHIQNSLKNTLHFHHEKKMKNILAQTVDDRYIIIMDQNSKVVYLTNKTEKYVASKGKQHQIKFWQDVREMSNCKNNNQNGMNFSAGYFISTSYKYGSETIRVECRAMHLNEDNYTFIELLVPRHAPQHHYTGKEKVVLDLILEGKNNNDIAEQLQVSVNTVKTHVRNILKKNNLKSRLELILAWKKD